MNFDPKKFVLVAGQIESSCHNEECIRSAINRYYYACFGTARELLDINTNDLSVHSEVIRVLKSDTSANLNKAGSYLENLFKFRKDSDYKYRVTVIKSTSNLAAEYSNKFFASIEAFKNEPELDD